jgi:hypothetical protein
MLELKSAKGDRAQHYQNLNDWSRNGYPAREMLGKFWQIDAYTYDEALGQLPPEYCPGGFRWIEYLTGDISATFIRVGGDYWCGYTDKTSTKPGLLINTVTKRMIEGARRSAQRVS